MEITIRGDSRLVCLFGYPVAHSLSPQIHNRAFSALHMSYVYVPMPVPPRALQAAVFALRELNMAGANVTIPHKQNVIHYCDTISPLSSKTGTVNTLYFRDKMLCGTTTDPQGFMRALASISCDPRDREIVILGNGGTARTLACYLALERIPAHLTIVGRNSARISALASEITMKSGFAVDSCALDNTTLAPIMERCTLLVNCTSAGMHPHTNCIPIGADMLHSAMTVFDTIYNPLRTKLLERAAAKGCAIQNGLRMLLYQAMASFELWTGVEPDESIFDLAALERQISTQSTPEQT